MDVTSIDENHNDIDCIHNAFLKPFQHLHKRFPITVNVHLLPIESLLHQEFIVLFHEQLSQSRKQNKCSHHKTSIYFLQFGTNRSNLVISLNM